MAKKTQSLKNVTDIPLLTTSKEKAREVIGRFTTNLILQAKTIAYREGHEMVLQDHVEEAEKVIFSKPHKSWGREILKVVGGVFLGAFIPGIVDSITSNSIFGIVVYVILGITGTAMVLL